MREQIFDQNLKVLQANMMNKQVQILGTCLDLMIVRCVIVLMVLLVLVFEY